MNIPSYIFLMIPVFLLSLTVHEFAHALTANWGGDRTATYQGRLTLNPIAHIDPIGTLVVPIIAAISNIPLFGWAKPVPVQEANFRKPNWGVVVALAGPGSNLILILLTAIIMKILYWLIPDQLPRAVVVLGILMIQINLVLMLFNLIPIPPLDGSHILQNTLPYEAARQYEKIRPYGFLILVAAIWFNLLSVFFIPARWAMNFLLGIVVSLGSLM